MDGWKSPFPPAEHGPGRRFASIHAEVPAEEDILVSHDIIDTIERDILAQKGVHLVIHMDPVAVGDPQLEYYRGLVKEALAAVGEGLPPAAGAPPAPGGKSPRPPPPWRRER